MPEHYLRRLVCLLFCWAMFTACAFLQQPASTSDPTLMPPTPDPQITPSATAVPVVHDIQAPFAWYVWQGYVRNGDLEPGAKFNCGPATVAMALRYGSNNMIQLSPEAVRDTIPRRAGTQTGMVLDDLLVALEQWQMPAQRLRTLAEIESAIARDHIVLVNLHMSAIAPEQEAIAPVPGSTLASITGRYYTYDQQHGLVLKGLIRDSQTGLRYFVVYDPNVWAGNPAYYYYGDARYPKGLNRLYAYEEIVSAMQPPHFFEAIEILASPAQPVAVAQPILHDPVDVAAAWCYQTAADVAEVVWCD